MTVHDSWEPNAKCFKI